MSPRAGAGGLRSSSALTSTSPGGSLLPILFRGHVGTHGVACSFTCPGQWQGGRPSPGSSSRTHVIVIPPGPLLPWIGEQTGVTRVEMKHQPPPHLPQVVPGFKGPAGRLAFQGTQSGVGPGDQSSKRLPRCRVSFPRPPQAHPSFLSCVSCRAVGGRGDRVASVHPCPCPLVAHAQPGIGLVLFAF